MALLDLFRRRKDTEDRAGPNALDPVTADHWIVQRIDALNQAGFSVAGDGPLKQTTVFACVRVLAETISSLPLYLYERTSDEGKEPARDHYLWELLHDAPNNFQTSMEFFEQQMAHLCLRGNAYSFIERNGAGRIARLIPLNPDRITVNLKNPRSQELEYEYTDPEGKKEVLPASDVWHQKGMSTDGYVGLNPIEMARRAILLGTVAEDHGIAYFQNGARASGIAKLPGALKETAQKRLQESLQSAMSGGNKFRVLVFEQGMEWQQLSLTNEDSQYLETRSFQVEEIARLFRVPCILIGHPDKSSTYASAEQFMLSFVIHTIRPWLVRIERSIGKYLLSDSERKQYFAKFKVEGLLRGDTASRYAAYASAINARWMSPNEVRALEDMNPREGGDEFLNPAIDKVPKPSDGEDTPKPKPPPKEDITDDDEEEE